MKTTSRTTSRTTSPAAHIPWAFPLFIGLAVFLFFFLVIIPEARELAETLRTALQPKI